MATTAQNMDRKSPGMPLIGLILAVVLGIVGIAAWLYQLSQGMQVTSLNQQVVWGLYIAAFFTAVGGGAVLLALAGLSAFTPLLTAAQRTRALAVSLAAFFAGAIFIAMDVGNPVQIWRVITAFRFDSLMTWDFWMLLIAAVVAIVYLWTSRAGGANKVLAALAIAAAVAVVAVEGWMLSVLSAHPMWSSGLTLVAFLINAAVAGLGLVLLAVTQQETVRKLLLAALGLSLLLALAEVLTGALSGDPRTREEISLLLTGALAPAFWFHIVIGLVIPIVLIARRQFLPAAAALAVIGVVAEKVWFLAAGQAQPWLPLEGRTYLPSGLELAAVIGMAGLAVVVFWALMWFVQKRQAA